MSTAGGSWHDLCVPKTGRAVDGGCCRMAMPSRSWSRTAANARGGRWPAR
jgi:hypothetical protein